MAGQNNQIDIQDESFITIPANKLDADQYSADDLDGVTESLFGSGNMAYASLQASQTDAALNAESAQNQKDSQDSPTDTDRPIAQQGDVHFGDSSDSGFTSSTVGSLSASQLSSDDGAFAPTGSGLSFKNGLGTSPDVQINNATKNTDNHTADRSNDDQNDNASQATQTSITIDDSTTIHSGDTIIHTDNITQIVNENIDWLGDSVTNLTVDLGNIIETATHIDLTTITNINNVTEQVTNVSETVTQGVTDITENIVEITQDVTTILDSTINQITETTDIEIVTNAVDILNDTTHFVHTTFTSLNQQINTLINNIGFGDDRSEGDVDLATDINITDIPFGYSSDNIVNTAIDIAKNLVSTDADIIINPVEDIIGDIDINLDIATDLLNNQAETDNQAGDQDIDSTTNIEIIDDTIADIDASIALDPAEHIVGDIDIEAGAAINILGDTASPLINDGAGGSTDNTITAEIGDVLSETADHIVDITIGDTVTKIDADLDLLNGNESASGDDNNDVTGDITIEIADHEIITAEQEAAIDPIEEITGDIDLDISAAIDLISNDINIDNLIDSSSELTDNDNNWTESTIEDSNLFDDIANNNMEDSGLPDPAGTVAEGLGVLDIEAEIDLSSTGGVFC